MSRRDDRQKWREKNLRAPLPAAGLVRGDETPSHVRKRRADGSARFPDPEQPGPSKEELMYMETIRLAIERDEKKWTVIDEVIDEAPDDEPKEGPSEGNPERSDE